MTSSPSSSSSRAQALALRAPVPAWHSLQDGAPAPKMAAARKSFSHSKKQPLWTRSSSVQGALSLDKEHSVWTVDKEDHLVLEAPQSPRWHFSTSTCNTQCGLFPLGAGWFRKPERGIVMSTVGIDGAIINHLRMDVAHWWVCGLGMGLDIGVGVRCRTPLGRGRERF